MKRLRQFLTSAGTFVCAAFLFRPVCSGTTPMQSYVEAMQPGTNLGNTLDAIPDETSWGNPATTQAMIQQFAAAGYKSIRLPVTWSAHTGGAPNYTVDPAWLNRVQQIVDWSLQSGMRVMLNMHHDSWQWLSALPQNHDAVIAQYSAVWTQISQRFANYPNTLMFEAINEPTFNGVDGATALRDLDEVETVFFNVVRGSGGANLTRPLVLTVLGGGATPDSVASLGATLQHLHDPNIITTFHFYGFWPFSVNIVGYTAFDQGVVNDITTTFDSVYNAFVAKGIPAVVGEFGVLAGDHIERGEYLKYHEFVAQYARSERMTHMYWDAGQFFNRTSFQWNDPQLHATLQQTLTGRATTADKDLIFVSNGGPAADTTINLNLNGNRFVSLTAGATAFERGVDYTYQDGVLTIKGTALSAYTTGAPGEKAVLTVNVDSGPGWDLHVRNVSPVVLSAASGSTGGQLIIPAAMNGDVLATLEARHADGTPAGPANWTAFKQWGDFLPDYANSTITLSNTFFKDEPVGTIDLTFHFWSGQKATYRVSIHPGQTAGGSDLTIYDDGLPWQWQNWSWASVNTANTAPVHAGSNSISVDAGAWGAVFLGNIGGSLSGTYHTLTFWANGGPVGGQQVTVSASSNWNFSLPSFTLTIPANGWTKFEVPLASIGVDADPNITSLTFMNSSGGTEPTFYLDDIHLTPAYASWLLFVDGTPTTATPATAAFAVKTHEVHRDGSSHRLVQVVDVINQSGHDVTGPISLVLKGLSTNTTVTNATGLTSKVVPCGDPYVIVTTTGLTAGAKASVTVQFSNPPSNAGGNGVGDDGKDITYTPAVLGDGALP